MAYKKKEENKLQKNLHFYGTNFEYKFVKSLIENPSDFNEIYAYLHPGDVEDKGLQLVIKTMLAYNDRKGRPGTWKELEYAIKDQVDTEEDAKEAKDAFIKAFQSDNDAMDDVSAIGIKFLKQQEAKRIYGLCSSKLDKDGYTPDGIENAIDLLRSIEKKTQAKYDSPYSLFKQVMSEGPDERVTTGIPQLDRQMNGGLGKGTTGILVAGTGVGKTTLMSYMATMIAAAGYKVLYLYFEDKPSDMQRKVYAAITGLNTNAFMNNNPDAEIALRNALDECPEFKNALDGKENLRYLKLVNGETTVEELKIQVRSLMKRDGWKPDVVFLDYMSCIQSSSDKRLAIDKEYQTLERAMKKIDAFAAEENFAFWVAQQTNRSGAKGESDDTPEANVQGSYRLLQTASAILYLERNRDYGDDINRANLRLRKCRGGELKDWYGVYLNNGTCQLDLEDGGGEYSCMDPDREFFPD